ncbi:solute carrier family 15 (peptide/histidine transporter), member 3/4 [Sarotherodon galilaeus]
MEIVVKESIKIPNSVIIKGLTNSDLDEEVATYLGKHGSVNQFHRQMIAEFNHASAMDTLNPLLPHTIQSSAQPEITFEIRSLAEVYAANARNVTRAYMKQLSEMANLSGHLLKEGLANLNASPLSSQPTVSSPANRVETSSFVQGDHSPDQTAVDSSQSKVPTPTLNQNLIDLNLPTQLYPTLELNPPSVQRVVVEHVVRTSEMPSHSPMPTDYNTWRTSIEVLINDPAISDLNCTQRILYSLLLPDITKHLGPDAKPSEYLKVLDSAFGAVEDGDELYARFMNTLQNKGERPSAYLQRLHVCLTKAMRHRGVSASDFHKQLLKQFLHGCWEDSLISDLQLGQRKESPPSFSELLLLLHTEEEASVKSQNYVTTSCSSESDFDVLKKQIADLSAQRNSWKMESQKQNQPKQSKSKRFKTNAKPCPWHCFYCGEDGHIASSCENEPNPSLVDTKKKQPKERQASWEASTRASDEPHLN